MVSLRLLACNAEDFWAGCFVKPADRRERIHIHLHLEQARAVLR
jgi:hypothetical protein